MNFIKNILSKVKHWDFLSSRRNYFGLLAVGGLVGFSSFHIQNGNFQKHDREISFGSNEHETTSKSRNFIAKIAKDCTSSIVQVRVQDKSKIDRETGQPVEVCKGSGFAVKSNGWILTNAHNIMLKKNYTVEVITENGIVCEASVVDVDLHKDLALLKIDYNYVKPLKFGNSEDVIGGEWIVALGNHETLSNRVTAGVVSSINRDAKELGLKSVSLNYIQTDAALTHEHAGGPLVNLKSEVIGVNNLRVTPGISFALPVDYVKEFLMKNSIQIDKECKNYDDYCQFNNTCCGITTIPITISKFNHLSSNVNNTMPKENSDIRTGVLVWNVVHNSSAHKAGILPGDLITHIDDKPVRSIADLFVKLFWEAEDNVNLTLHRRGSVNSVTLQLKN